MSHHFMVFAGGWILREGILFRGQHRAQATSCAGCKATRCPGQTLPQLRAGDLGDSSTAANYPGSKLCQPCRSAGPSISSTNRGYAPGSVPFRVFHRGWRAFWGDWCGYLPKLTGDDGLVEGLLRLFDSAVSFSRSVPLQRPLCLLRLVLAGRLERPKKAGMLAIIPCSKSMNSFLSRTKPLRAPENQPSTWRIGRHSSSVRFTSRRVDPLVSSGRNTNSTRPP